MKLNIFGKVAGGWGASIMINTVYIDFITVLVVTQCADCVKSLRLIHFVDLLILVV